MSFLTLRTTPELLLGQLDRRIAAVKQPPKRLRKLRPLYADGQFLAHWYDRWLAFLEGFKDRTTGSYFVDVHRDYALSAVAATALLMP